MAVDRARAAPLVLLLTLIAAPAAADIFLYEGTNLSVDVARDGRFATDLLGTLWVVPADGGEASALSSGEYTARRPRWSPDDRFLVYESLPSGRSKLRLYSMADDTNTELSTGPFEDRQPDWHPDGTRVVFASDRDIRGSDIWEINVATRVERRLSDRIGDESEPAWSPDGEDLVYVHEYDGLWRIVLKRRGRPEEVIAASDRRLAAPSWRPDGTLITHHALGDDGWTVRMTILSEPRLERTLIDGEDFFLSPVVWPDRQTMIYAGNGKIRRRAFNSWTSEDVPFGARVGAPEAPVVASRERRKLLALDMPKGKTVIRAPRLFDGLSDDYQVNRDIVIDGGRISSVQIAASHDDAIVVDLGDVTVLPGLIDAFGALPGDADFGLGPVLLSLGVTTLVSEGVDGQALTRAWSGKALPGPRVLNAAPIGAAERRRPPWLLTVGGDQPSGVQQREQVREWLDRGVPVLAESWQIALGSGASLLLGTGARPTSPGGHSYQDVQLARGANAVTLVSGLADASTPSIDALLATRAASRFPGLTPPTRRFDVTPNLSAAAGTIVLGSRPNGLPAGIGLHAELRALVAAGLSNAQALKAAGVNAASALGLGLDLGRVSTGAAADLIIVDGDPLSDIDDALNIIAVVRNGRFFSVPGLLDRSDMGKNVE
ncbi:MAG: amidohydrolase family protein [Pseudomonadota bacterium]